MEGGGNKTKKTFYRAIIRMTTNQVLVHPGRSRKRQDNMEVIILLLTKGLVCAKVRELSRSSRNCGFCTMRLWQRPARFRIGIMVG